MDIGKKAIKVTLDNVEGAANTFFNTKKELSTRLIEDELFLKKEVDLFKEEKPLLEYFNKGCYSLVTSKRVISFREQSWYEIDLMDINSVRKLIRRDHFEEQEEIKILRIISEKNEEFLVEFDFGIPAYFALMLITNLSYKLKFGRWFYDRG